MMSPRVLLLTLSERTSAKGRRYMSGWLGKASVVAFEGEPDKHGNPTWDVFVSTPEPRPEQREGLAGGARSREVSEPAKPAQKPAERGSGWKGSEYRRDRAARSEPLVPAAAALIDDEVPW